MDSWVLKGHLQSSMLNYDPGNIFVSSAEKLQVKITQVENKTQQNSKSINKVKINDVRSEMTECSDCSVIQPPPSQMFVFYLTGGGWFIYVIQQPGHLIYVPAEWCPI